MSDRPFITSEVCPVLTRELKGTLNATWHLNGGEYDPVEATYRLMNCGEETFAAVYRAIAAAKQTVDIVCWGFQPSMYFIRDGSETLSIGQLLERKAADGVRIKVLGWDMDVMGYNPVGLGGEANLPGRTGVANRNQTKRQDDARAYSLEGRFTSTDAQYAYDRYWFGMYMDKQDKVPIHPRYQHHPGLSQHQQRLQRQQDALLRFRGRGFGPLERLEILWRMRYRNLMPASVTSATLNAAFPTHHQKCVLVDYGLPERAIGFVMGHNMLDEYWDTEAHSCRATTPDRGRNGAYPRQDISAVVSGPVLYYLHKNFVEGWQDATGEDLARDPARQAASARYHSEDHAQRCALLRRDQGQVTMAQILRTQSQKNVRDIAALYTRMLKNATRLVYVENQYFRWLPFADEIKKVAARLAAAGADPGKYGNLNLFVITNSSDEGVGPGILNTYKLLDSLGRADTIPNVARSQEIDWRKQQLKEAKATQARLESRVNRSAAQAQRGPGHDALLKQVNEARDAVLKAREALSASQMAREAAEKNHQQQAILPRAIPGLSIHVCSLVAPDSPGYQPDVFRPIPANPRQSLAMRYDPQADAAPRQLIKNTTWPEVYIHSKLLIIDDHFVSNGSANLNMRSMQTDSELNILCANPQVARGFRQRLWRQHTTGHFGDKIVWGAQDDPDAAFRGWADLIKANKDAQHNHQRPEASLVGLLRSSPEIKDQD